MAKCYMYKGALIPGCWGAAFACGCGMSLSEIKTLCTCKQDGQSDWNAQQDDEIEALRKRVMKLEQQVKVIGANDADK